MTTHQHRTAVQADDDGHITECLCGNNPAIGGFLYVRRDDAGQAAREVEFTTGEPESGLFLWCPDCRRLLDVEAFDPVTLTYPVIGRLEHVRTLH